MSKSQSTIIQDSKLYESYCEAWHHFTGKNYDDALEIFQKISLTKDRLSRKATMATALIHLEMENFKAGECILKDECEYFLSDERRQETANLYFELAQKALEKTDGTESIFHKPDYEKALRLYDFLLEQELTEELLDKVLYLRAKTAMDAENYGYARTAFFEYLNRFDPVYRQDISGSEPTATNPLSKGQNVMKSRIGLVKTCLLMDYILPPENQFAHTSFDSLPLSVTLVLDSILKESKTEKTDSLPEETNDILMEASYLKPFAMGLTLDFSPDGTGPLSPDSARKAIESAKLFIDTYPHTKKALTMSVFMAQALYKAGFISEAKEQLESVMNGENLHFAKEEIKELYRAQSQCHFQLAEMYYNEGLFEEAFQTWKNYLSKYSDGEQWSMAQNGTYRSSGAIAIQSLMNDDFENSRDLLADIARKRGLSDEQGWIHLTIAQTWIIQGEKAVEKKCNGNEFFEKALLELSVITKRYDDEIKSWAHLLRADIFRRHLNDIESAVTEYEISHSAKGNEALIELKGIELVLTTEKIFTSKEEPFIQIHSRNIDELSVKIYPINLEDYFRKYHTAKNIDNLDLDLVSPEMTFRHTIKDYVRYSEMKYSLPLPLKKKGAYAITVEGEKHESTVMVLVSDIHLMSAVSDSEIVTLVKDATSNTPVRNARLNLFTGTDSKAIEYKTDSNGTGHCTFDSPLLQAPALFARKGENVAVVNGFIPEKNGSSLQCRGYIYTSRPVYVPGETVRGKGIICHIENGNYVIREGNVFTVSIITPSGKSIGTAVPSLNEYGTIAFDFTIPLNSETGNYTVIAVSEDEKFNFSSSFSVEYVKPSKISLRLTSDCKAAQAGETITFKAQAAYYTGAPLSQRKVSITLPSGTVLSKVTDSNGEATFTLDTTLYFRYPEIHIEGRIAGEGVFATMDIPLLSAAVKVDVQLPPGEIFAGNHLPVQFNVLYPDETPVKNHQITGELYISQKGQLPPVSKELAQKAGLDLSPFEKTSDTVVEKICVHTDNSGSGMLSLKMPFAGSARLVLTTMDDKGQKLVVSRTFEIQDLPFKSLSIETGSTLIQEGDSLPVSIHNNEEPGLGLIIISGSAFISWETFDFSTGENPYTFSASGEHCPNVSITALCDGRKNPTCCATATESSEETQPFTSTP